MPRIFISYAKKDTRALAEGLHSALTAIPGLTAWMDMSLEADESWAYQIQQEIDRADYVVVLLSPDVNRPVTATQRRSFVLNEIDYAQQDNKLILPVLAQRTKMPVQIAGVQYIDLTATPNDPSPVVERVCQRFNLESPAARRKREMEAEQRQQERERRQRELAERAAREEVQRRQREAVPATPAAPHSRNASLRWIGPVLLVTVLLAGGLFVANTLSNPLTPTPTLRPTTTPTPRPTVTPTQPTSSVTMSGIIRNERAGEPGDAATAADYDYRAGNAAWTPAAQTFDDGIEMVLVPAGCFRMGSDDGQRDEQPVSEVCFESPFWIDRTEVTQADFERLGGVKANANGFVGDARPVERITWFEARDFCAARGARLPTEAEWEYAARGPDALIYPWGDTFVGENAVFFENSNNQTANVGSRPAGASWVGALDMSGNVWEWVSTIYGVDDGDFDFSDSGERLYRYPYIDSDGREANSDNRTDIRVLRGGSWYSYFTGLLRAGYRVRFNPDYWNFDLGFRCARSA